jgi:hypothetical protein
MFRPPPNQTLDISNARKRRRQELAIHKANEDLLVKLQSARSSIGSRAQIRGKHSASQAQTQNALKANSPGKVLPIQADMPEELRTFTSQINGKDFYFMLKKKDGLAVLYAFNGLTSEH